MKKFMAFLLVAAMIMSLGLTAGCEEVEDSSHGDKSKSITKVEYVSGLSEEYGQGSSLTLSDIKIKVYYDDGTSEEVGYNKNDFKIAADTSEINPAVTVVITYKNDYDCEKTVAVVAVENYDITDVMLSESYNTYKTNKAVVSTDDNMGFKDNAEPYYVGDMNPFVFRPTVSGKDTVTGFTNEDIQNISFEISLAVKDGENYTAVENEAEIAEIDNEACSVDFVPAAVGHEYEITFYPGNIKEEQLEDPGIVKHIEVKVVDGYNVTSFEEFTLVDNGTNTAWKRDNVSISDEWGAIRTAAGITANPSDVHALVLHKNIKLDPEKLPKGLLLNEGDGELIESQPDYEDAKGSLRDWNSVMLHKFAKGEKFGIYGNYFNVDATQLPIVVRNNANEPLQEDEVIVSHANFLRFICKEEDTSPAETEDEAREALEIRDISFTGNLKREETSRTGGSILMKMELKSHIYNVLARAWYITAFSQYNHEYNPVVLEKNKYFDNYNSMLYNWGGHLVVKDSVMKGAGGPLFIADHTNPKKYPDKEISNTVFDDQCVLESYVAGKEGWFVQMNATAAAAQILTMDVLFRAQGQKSYLKDGQVSMFNFIGLIKSGQAEGMTFEPVKGYAAIGDHSINMDMSQHPMLQAFQGKTVLFQTKGNLAAMGMIGEQPALCKPEKLLDYMQGKITDPSEIVAKNDEPVFTEDDSYLNLFIGDPDNIDGGYMGAILGNYHKIG